MAAQFKVNDVVMSPWLYVYYLGIVLLGLGVDLLAIYEFSIPWEQASTFTGYGAVALALIPPVLGFFSWVRSLWVAKFVTNNANQSTTEVLVPSSVTSQANNNNRHISQNTVEGRILSADKADQSDPLFETPVINHINLQSPPSTSNSQSLPGSGGSDRHSITANRADVSTNLLTKFNNVADVPEQSTFVSMSTLSDTENSSNRQSDQRPD